MSCSSSQNEAGASAMRVEQPEGMESESSSGQSDESTSSGSETGGSSSCSPDPQRREEQARRAAIRCLAQQRTRKSLASVACQTDYTEEWTPMRSLANDDSASSSSEGTLRLMIQNFKSMSDTVRGPSKEILGVSWRIMVMPRQHVVQKKGTQKCLGFFLQCCPDAYSEQWSCQAQAELRLISQKNNVPHFTRKTNHNYTAKENDWGYSCFMTWADILDESQGYIKDDRVILEVTVKAEPPKNILSHCEFKKRIEKWKDLAEMHFNRNCIDLAIEANFQAIKFCKDRDADIKAMLEEQRNYFIEQKVQESIQRIEKGKDQPAKPEDEGTSQSALKQALTQSTSKYAQKKGKVQKKTKTRIREPSASPPTTPPSSEVRVEEQPKTETAATIKNIPYTREVDGKLVFEGSFSQNMDDILPCCNKLNAYDFPADVDLEAIKQSISWTRRNHEDEQFYNELAMPIIESFEKLQLTVDHQEALESYNDQLAAYDADTQQIMFQELLQRNFVEAFTKKQIKTARKKEAIEAANTFSQEVLARVAMDPDESAAIDEEIAGLNASLDFLDNEESKIWRNSLLDRMNEDVWSENSLFLLVQRTPWTHPYEPVRAKINFLESIPRAASWLPEDYYSDEGAELSSDSERQTDGCSKAKRYKRDRKPAPAASLVEMACQTDLVPQKTEDTHDAAKTTATAVAAPPGRVLKKPQKKNKKVEQPVATTTIAPPLRETENRAPTPVTTRPVAASQTQTQTVASATAPVPAILPNLTNAHDARMANFGSFRVVAAPLLDGEGYPGAIVPRILPMEYAMKFFPNSVPDLDQIMKMDPTADPNKIMEEWVRGWLQEAQSARPNGAAMPQNPQEFIAAYSDQVVSALSAVALNFMNVRRLTSKVNELIINLQERTITLRLNKLHTQIFNMAGMTYEIPSESAVKPLPDVTNSDGDSVLAEQIEYINDIKAKLEEQIKNEKEITKRVSDALKKIDDKLRTNEKTVEELKKKVDEQEKAIKKADKHSKQEITNLRTQLTAEKDRNSTLGKELKERNKEVKRLETRCNTVTVERDEFTEKHKNIQRDMTTLQKKHSDEVNKLRREMSSLNESRKNLQNGIAERDNENKSLQHQIEERNSQIKKLKQELEQEKQRAIIANREVERALERARKSEIDLLNRELESGVALLERAHSDATKHIHEMEEAASSRARNQTEMNTYINNKNEWTTIVEQIDGFIKKAKIEFSAQIEAIQGGKALSTLSKISVPKPPPPPPIIKIPVVVPVEPTKNGPGPIGPPRQPMSSNISPQSRAPGSPIPKHSQHSPGSPVRHPGAIGTRPNGAPVNGSSSANNSLYEQASTSLLTNWSLPFEPFDNFLNHPPSSSEVLSLASSQGPPRVDQNGWDEQNNTWSNSHTTSVNQYISGPLSQSRSTSSNMYNNHSPGWPRPQSAQHQPLSVEQQRLMQVWQPIIDRVSKKLHVDVDQAFQLVRQYVMENNINLTVARVTPDDIADAIYQKRFSETTSRLPPGAAPGYLQNPLMGNSFLDRNPIAPPLGSMLNTHEHLLNNLLGDSMRPSSSTDKWANGL